MLPPAASYPEQLVAAVAARLAGITLAESDPRDPTRRRYAYAPASVARADDFKAQYLRSEHDTQYLVRAGEDTPVAQTTGTFDRQLEVWVLGATKSRLPTNPHGAVPEFEQAQNALARDVEIRLLEDVRLAGVAYAVEIGAVGRDFEIEANFPWAVVELRVLIRYRYRRGEA